MLRMSECATRECNKSNFVVSSAEKRKFCGKILYANFFVCLPKDILIFSLVYSRKERFTNNSIIKWRFCDPPQTFKSWVDSFLLSLIDVAFERKAVAKTSYAKETHTNRENEKEQWRQKIAIVKCDIKVKYSICLYSAPFMDLISSYPSLCSLYVYVYV